MKLLDVMSIVNYSTQVRIMNITDKTLYEGVCRDFFDDDDYAHYAGAYDVEDIRTTKDGTMEFVVYAPLKGEAF